MILLLAIAAIFLMACVVALAIVEINLRNDDDTDAEDYDL